MDPSKEDSGYVFVCMDENRKDEGVELPLEADGTMLVSVLQSQFNGASGLKYRNTVTGAWRAIKLMDGLLRPPDKGWGDTAYVVVHAPSVPGGALQGGEGAELEERGSEKGDGAPCATDDFSPLGYTSDGYKRKLEDSEGQRAPKNPRSSSPDDYPKPASPSASPYASSRNQEDLIILGLEYSVTDQELRTYFEQFGEVTECMVKKDRTGKSRGFGFVRYGDRAVQASVQAGSHAIKGRRVELKHPKQSPSSLPNKLFIGCLPLKPEATSQELTEYFSQYGRLDDVYIPKPYRGFGFVTFTDPLVAQKVVSLQHTIRKSNLNVSYADPKRRSAFLPTDPYMSANYQGQMSRMPGGHQGAASHSHHPLQQQAAYTVGYGTPQHMVAIPRAEQTSAMGTVHAMPVSSGQTMAPHAASATGLYALSYGNGTHQQQQQSYSRPSPGGTYR